MLDRYWYGATTRISPEAPVPIVLVENEEHRPGGAANVAVNIAALGGQVCLIGLVGDDEQGQTLEKLLKEKNVECKFERPIGYPTVTKLRVISRHQQLLRMDFEKGFPKLAGNRLLEMYRESLDWATVVILSDYAKGTLCDTREMIRLAKAAGKIVLVDPKLRNFTAYQGADLITPNLAEMEMVVGACSTESVMVERGTKLIADHGLGALLITRGEKGMTLLRPQEPPKHLPAQAREVYDVTGAGDTVISVLAAGLAAGLPLMQAVTLSNYAAGIVVGKLGAATVSIGELEQVLHGQGTTQRGVVTESELFSLVQSAKLRGEIIVFTNGCFDILHSGHVTYLEEASKLGNRLIVAVNVDQTVRELKGPDRPVNSLNQRLAVLAALACVDWVIPFKESTPERLICTLQPDLLVKGGDNDPTLIPGADCVRRSGGRVQTLSYVNNCSTTEIIRRIRN